MLSDNAVRFGECFPTFVRGIDFYPYDPRPEEVFIEDIAHALSLICRYNGQIAFHYSVATHSILMCDFALGNGFVPEVALEFLMHDAAEAYCGDMVAPIKRGLGKYCSMEDNIFLAVAAQFGLRPGICRRAIKEVDVRIRVDEKRALQPARNAMRAERHAADADRALGIDIPQWTPERAEMEFLSRFHRLAAARSASKPGAAT